MVRVEGLEPSIPKAIDFKSITYTNSVTLAILLLYIMQHCMSTTIWYPCSESNREQFLLLRETTLPICPQGYGGLREN